MTYSHEVEHMCVVKKGPNHGPAPIPEEGKWVKSKEIKDISGLTPVSYTHLDVYKRQGFNCLAPKEQFKPIEKTGAC